MKATNFKREKKVETERESGRKWAHTFPSLVINSKRIYRMRLYTENYRQCIFDQNYLPTTDKTKDIIFKFNLVKMVVEGIG